MIASGSKLSPCAQESLIEHSFSSAKASAKVRLCELCGQGVLLSEGGSRHSALLAGAKPDLTHGRVEEAGQISNSQSNEGGGQLSGIPKPEKLTASLLSLDSGDKASSPASWLELSKQTGYTKVGPARQREDLEVVGGASRILRLKTAVESRPVVREWYLHRKARHLSIVTGAE